MIYSDLADAIMAWVNRPEAEQFVPTFVTLAEAQINRDLAENGISGAVVRSTVSVDSEYVDAPASMAVPLSLHIGDSRLENVTELGYDALKPHVRTVGQPRHFTVISGEFRFLPIPDATYSATLLYEATLQALGDANPSNWVLAGYPDAYLYGALAQTAPFLGDDARLTVWAGLYASTIMGLVKAERAKRGGQTTRAYRAGIPNRHGFGISHGGSTPTPTPPPPNPAPANTALPVISGTTTQGQVVACSAGTWANSPAGFAYAWFRGGVAILGATNSAYVLASVDVGHTLTCSVTATNANGSTVATSAPTATISAAGSAPTNTVLPAITGTAQQGQLLSCSTGTWTDFPTSYTYAWKRDGSAISGATVSTYTLATADVGHVVTCAVTAANISGSTSTTSAGTSAVIPIDTGGLLDFSNPNNALIGIILGVY